MTERVRPLISANHPLVRAGLQDVPGSRPDFEVIGEAITGAEAVELTDRLHPHSVRMVVG